LSSGEKRLKRAVWHLLDKLMSAFVGVFENNHATVSFCYGGIMRILRATFLLLLDCVTNAVLKTSIALLLSIANLIAQDNTTYFPLHIGDYWLYNEGTLRQYGRKVEDSVRINDKKYYVRLVGVGNHSYEERDTVRLTEMNDVVFYRDCEEYILYKFNAAIGDTWSYTTNGIRYAVRLIEKVDSFQIQEGPLMGTYQNVLEFRRDPVGYFDAWEVDYLAPGLGVIYRAMFLGQDILSGAVIDGKLYGDITTTAVEEQDNPLPEYFELRQNYPNPFNPYTTIEFSLPHSGFVTLKIYNLLGEEVATLVSEERNAGKYKVEWHASNMASGMYFYRLQAGGFMETKKLILLR
jgi:hypothetical protein